ncbi:MAG: hypothetical protein KAJ75_00925 [Alphaproteobacteria bacterium]|nr:hypothetical protein [Alphaproteobacteria bacterium]
MNSPQTALTGSCSEIYNDILKVKALISTSRTLLSKGNLIDIGALEDKIRLVCEKILESPAENKTDLRLSMEKILESMDFLAEDLHKHHNCFDTTENGSLKNFWNINKKTDG